MSTDSQMRVRYIPPNVFQSNRIFGFKKRNIYEGIAWAVLAGLLINMVPFVKKVKIIVTLCVAIFLLFFNAIGIKGCSFSETVINYIAYRKYMKQFSYRRLNENVAKVTPLIDQKGNVRTVSENRFQKNIKTVFGR